MLFTTHIYRNLRFNIRYSVTNVYIVGHAFSFLFFYFLFNFIAFVSATMRDVCERKQFKRENRLIVVDVVLLQKQNKTPLGIILLTYYIITLYYSN